MKKVKREWVCEWKGETTHGAYETNGISRDEILEEIKGGIISRHSQHYVLMLHDYEVDGPNGLKKETELVHGWRDNSESPYNPLEGCQAYDCLHCEDLHTLSPDCVYRLVTGNPTNPILAECLPEWEEIREKFYNEYLPRLADIPESIEDEGFDFECENALGKGKGLGE